MAFLADEPWNRGVLVRALPTNCKSAGIGDRALDGPCIACCGPVRSGPLCLEFHSGDSTNAPTTQLMQSGHRIQNPNAAPELSLLHITVVER